MYDDLFAPFVDLEKDGDGPTPSHNSQAAREMIVHRSTMWSFGEPCKVFEEVVGIVLRRSRRCVCGDPFADIGEVLIGPRRKYNLVR